jgi:MFS family permease
MRNLRAQGLTVVAACFVALFVSPVSLSFQTVGLFVKPMSTEFGWDRATFFIGPSIGILIGALLSPFSGALADRWGVRWVLATGVVIFGVGTASLGAMNGGMPAYLAANILLYAAGQVQSTSLYSKVVAGWFDRRRGLMLAVAASGFGVGGMINPFIAKILMERYGWRWTYFGLGLLIIMVALPAILLVVRERPVAELSAGPPRPSGSVTRSGLGLTLQQAARTRIYWSLIGFFFLTTFALTGVVTNMVAMLVDRGLPMAVAVFALSTLALSQSIGRLISGYLLDRVPVAQISLIWFVGCLIGLGVLVTAHSPMSALFAAAMLGLAWGAEGEMTGFYASRYFGLDNLAAITGTVFAAIGVAAAFSQVTVAWLFDRTHNYQYAISIMIAVMLAACALLASLGPYIFTCPARDDLT